MPWVYMNSPLTINYSHNMGLILLFGSAKEEQNSVLMLKFACKDSRVKELQNPCDPYGIFMLGNSHSMYYSCSKRAQGILSKCC